ncbi:MAG: hypothetical protein ISS25_02075 [Nanoarchaeota archaeon]|nr:hypothetical protein [DPANN group archaeon]MBL7116593.1 hypothetical protein [Nanoarchaeota archaeon]
MRKTTILVAMVLLLMVNIVSAVDRPYLTATLMKYEPQPAEPGKYTTVFIKLENTGTGTAQNVILEIDPEYPFSLDPGKTNQEYVGLLGGGSFHVAEFDLKVDENAIEGTNKLKVRYNIDANQEVWTEQKLEISVQTQEAVLSIEKIVVEPAEIVPGSSGTIKLELENLAYSTLSDIKVKLDLSSTTLPFAPFNSASEKSLYQLNPGKKHSFTFDIVAFPDAESKIYKVPVNITYYDNVGTAYSKSDLIGVIVNSKPDIKVVVDSTTLLAEKRIGDIVLKIVNKGLNDVKLMNMKLSETDKFEILSSSNEEYIGNLDSDDFETVDFKILFKGEDTVEIPLELEYMDNNNNYYKEDLTLKLKVHSGEKLGTSNGKGVVYLVVIVVVAVVAFIIYRRRKKKKHQ